METNQHVFYGLHLIYRCCNFHVGGRRGEAADEEKTNGKKKSAFCSVVRVICSK